MVNRYGLTHDETLAVIYGFIGLLLAGAAATSGAGHELAAIGVGGGAGTIGLCVWLNT